MTIITIVLMPFLIPFILEGAQTDPLYVMANLVVMILIPILIGIIIKNRSEPFAARLEPVMDYVSDISIAVIFLTLGIIFLSQLGEIVSTGSGALAVFVAIVFTLASIGITYLIGYSEKDSRRNLALGAGFRNITAVLVVVFASFTNLKKDARVAVFSSFTNIQNDVLLMVLMVTVFSIIIVSIIVGIIYKKRRNAEKKKLLS
jgi:BASS family bile acid:Na+ symporter